MPKRKIKRKISEVSTEIRNEVSSEINEIETKTKKIIRKVKEKSLKILGRTWRSIFPKMSGRENIFQYLFRQLLICDSSGTPSIRTTMLFIIMTLITLVVIFEIKVAISPLKQYDAAGKVVTEKLQGFSSEFIYLMIIIYAVISNFFNSREKERSRNSSTQSEETSETPQQEQSLIGTVVSTASEVISKIRGR